MSQVGRRIDEASPMVDARLPDGSRVNAVIHPVAIGGPFLTIRRFSKDPYTVDDLINFGSFTPQVAHFLDACVRGQLNMVISGGTGTGKTTLLNVVSSFIPDTTSGSSPSRTPRSSGSGRRTSARSRPGRRTSRAQGEVKIRELVRNALRMRPDRVIVGEARGAEALDMLQAMNTGHDGSLTTIHSNSPRDALSRIETMTLMGGIELPVRAIREQMASALDVIVHLSRLRDGTPPHHERVRGDRHGGRRRSSCRTSTRSTSEWASTRRAATSAASKSTGIRPNFSERLADRGVKLEPELFTLEPFARRVVGLR